MVRPSVYAPYIFISKPLGTRQAHAKHTAARGSTLTRDVSTLCSLDTMLVLSARTRWHMLQSVCAAVPRLCRIWRSHSLCTLHSTRCLHAPSPSTTPTQPVVPSLVAGLPPLFLFFGRLLRVLTSGIVQSWGIVGPTRGRGVGTRWFGARAGVGNHCGVTRGVNFT